MLDHWPVVSLLLLGELALLLFALGVAGICWAIPRLARLVRCRRKP